MKAQITVTDEKGRLFSGIVQLHLVNAVERITKPEHTKRKDPVGGSGSKVIMRFREFKNQGFFKPEHKRTIRQIQEKLRTKGISLKVESIQPYLTQMIKNDELERERADINGKKQFIYFSS